MPTLERLEELVFLITHAQSIYLRCSPSPAADAARPSIDYESGLPMSGLSANPLKQPGWWTLPPEDWVARRLCQCLRDVAADARPWVLIGKVVDHGPANEPLLADVRPIAWLSESMVRQAREHYRGRLHERWTTS
ncbi:DUF6098 family protein [Actinophytocola sp.]|uniref:DUF6098 family protein n=1 Tax=Actinophytocola sp. TaxID=1872138 RepID=UPI002ED884A6